MKVLKIYGVIWLFVLAALGFSYFTGLYNEMTLTIFGFSIATLWAMGLLAVLPALLDDHFSPKAIR